MAKTPGRKLGRGLSALMAEITPPEDAAVKPNTEAEAEKPDSKAIQASETISAGVSSLPIDKLSRNADQPRRHFDKALLEELTSSVKDKGVLQPILVRPLPSLLAKGKKREGLFQIVAGERRWQAALTAGLTHIPALVRELSDQEVLEIGVVENVQRADLNPIEEALAYQALKDQFGRRQEDIANAIGKSRAHVANTMRLLNLPDIARDYLAEGKITAGHARAVLSAEDPALLAGIIVDKGLSVRAAEDWVRAQSKPKAQKARTDRGYDADIRKVETNLSELLGLRVDIKHKSPGGQLQIKYSSLEEFDQLLKVLRGR